jgi:pilus assembly protein FimV
MAEAEPEAAPMEKPAVAEEQARPAEAKPQPKPKPEVKAKPKPAPVMAKPESEPKGMVDEYLDMAKGIFDSAMEIVTGMTKSMTKSLGGNSLLLYVAVPVLLVLLILMMIVVRRRKKAEGSYQESILSGGPSTVTSEEEGAEAEAGESSFLSDFAVSGAGAIQTEDSEVDPLTEADVFMAYGRYEAAEERLQEAITKDPSRKELKLKLLELYSSTKNSSAFETLAEDFYASLGGEADSDPMWAKVLSMGKELAPGNPLFAAGVASMATADVGQEPVSLSDSQVMDIGLETGVFQSEDFAAGGEAEAAGSDLDFNLDFGESTGEPETPAEAGGGMDFNLDLGGEPAEAAGSDMDFSLDMGVEEDKTPTQETETLDFNMEAEAAGSEAGEPDFSLDMGDTGGLSLDTGDDTLSMDVRASEEPTMSLDSSGLDFDAGDQGGGMDFDLGSSDSGAGEMSLGGGDEVGTKLDLAKAYIDMGDPDGARSILDEVLDEGNDSQKQEAQQLIQQIA